MSLLRFPSTLRIRNRNSGLHAKVAAKSGRANRLSPHGSLHRWQRGPRWQTCPRLVGFQSTIEREFFELFCSVDGVGVKKALRAMVQPVQDIAVTIEQQDAKGLSALPGVGPATAERIIAKLRRKMPRFALLVRRDAPGMEPQAPGLIDETFEALVVLGHAEADARRLIEQALAGGKKFKDSESMIQAIYENKPAQKKPSSSANPEFDSNSWSCLRQNLCLNHLFAFLSKIRQTVASDPIGGASIAANHDRSPSLLLLFRNDSP